MGSEPRTCWNKAYYNPMPPPVIVPPPPPPKLSKTRASFDPELCQKVYTALLEGCHGAKALREKLKLTYWQAAEGQRQLAKAGYVVKEGPGGRQCYVPANATIKKVSI